MLAIALVASTLTLFSGFGLGTLLLPAFALVFPLDVAIAATAFVHLANNVSKVFLVGRGADWATVWRFGLPAALAALVGGSLLFALKPDALWTYELSGTRSVTALGLVLGLLIIVFALFDLLPALRKLTVHSRFLVPGGLLSGFFGGLSGHQGALRSIFLGKLGLDAKAFIATGTLCAILVDGSRLAVYSTRYARNADAITAAGGWGLIAGAIVMAGLGAVLGARLLPKVTMESLRLFVGALLVVVGGLVAAGLV
ncbi:MAG: TSUP family transporter [Candidatus Thermoplasmatota archaeon]